MDYLSVWATVQASALIGLVLVLLAALLGATLALLAWVWEQAKLAEWKWQREQAVKQARLERLGRE